MSFKKRRIMIKISTYLFCLSFILCSYAHGSFVKNDLCGVGAPKNNVSFGTVFTPLFYKGSGTNFGYAAEVITSDLPPSLNVFQIRPPYLFGFDIALLMFIDERDTTLSIDWFHYKGSISDAQEFGPFFSFDPTADTSPFRDARVDHSFAYNLFDLWYFQHFRANAYFEGQLLFGLNVTRISESHSLICTAVPTNTQQIVTNSSNFTGAGPIIGGYANYKIIDNLNFNGRSLAFMIAGPFTAHFPFNEQIPTTASQICNPIRTEKITNVLFGFANRIGIQYVNSGKAKVKFEVGYEGLIFINPSQPIITKSNAIIVADGPTPTFARVFPPLGNLFAALSGPYIAFAAAY